VEAIIVEQIASTAAVTMSGRVGDLNAKQEAALKQVLDWIFTSRSDFDHCQQLAISF
jgi:hypothetical protein